MRPRLTVLRFAFGAGLLLASCGGAASASAPPAGSSSPAPKTSSAPAAQASPSVAAQASASAGGSSSSSKPAASAGLTELTIAQVGTSPSFTPIWLGIDEGLFQKHGLTLKLVSSSGSVGLAALMSSNVDIAMDGGYMVQADPGGKQLVFIGALQNAFNQFLLMAKPEYKTIKDLKGKTVAGATPASAATLALHRMLERGGLSPDDVKWTYAQTAPAEWAALANGAVDASGVTWPFYLEGMKKGLPVLADGKKLNIPAASLTMAVQRTWLKSHHAEVQNFLKAVVEATALANTDRAKAEAAISKHLKYTDKAGLDDAFARYGGTWPNPPYITKDAVQEAIDDVPKPQKQYTPDNYIDNGPLDELVQSGFTKAYASSSPSK